MKDKTLKTYTKTNFTPKGRNFFSNSWELVLKSGSSSPIKRELNDNLETWHMVSTVSIYRTYVPNSPMYTSCSNKFVKV